MFVLVPLAGLLLVSRPASLREVWWLAGAAAWLGVWLPADGGLADQFSRAAGMLVGGAFVVLMLAAPGYWFPRAAGALALGFAALAAWCARLGIGWGQLTSATLDASRQWYTLWGGLVRSRAGADPAAAARADQLLGEVHQATVAWARLYPGLIALIALGGLAIAWAWYQRVATRPMGRPLAPLRAFAFSDQFVWAAVLGLALLLAPAPPAVRELGRNLLLVLTVLYAVRGLGIFAALVRRVPGAVLAAGGLAALVLFPFAAAGLGLLGLADTWLDFRRLHQPSTGGSDR